MDPKFSSRRAEIFWIQIIDPKIQIMDPKIWERLSVSGNFVRAQFPLESAKLEGFSRLLSLQGGFEPAKSACLNHLQTSLSLETASD